MNKTKDGKTVKEVKKAAPKKEKAETGAKRAELKRPKTGVMYQESPVERALKLSSEQAIAMAIRDLIKRDELH